jgi:hypothetical protein
MNTLGEMDAKTQLIINRHNHHLKICSEYKKQHPEQNNAYSVKYFKSMKETEPEKYATYLARQKKYYNEVVKPRKQLVKELAEITVS